MVQLVWCWSAMASKKRVGYLGIQNIRKSTVSMRERERRGGVLIKGRCTLGGLSKERRPMRQCM